ncbi:MAG: formylglycine-generating enzyme family protein [Fimbriimonadaceae bacterium]|nr:SUMF1/EgtB/PvdO family nonheme iron enzyme [Chthonomonadaceae bacterium]MCO5297380.1 formylglycine-generating enzyme family protein [Fimbriimonadaceae bacterium]
MLTLALAALATVASHAQTPETFVQKLDKTLVEFTMVRVPDGSVTVGDKTIEVKNLWIGKTEVTWDLFDVWTFRLDLTQEELQRGVDAESRPSRPYGAPDRGFGHQGYPALGMAHQAAVRFCEWLSQKSGRKYRLPTEAEWIYAAGKPGDFAAEAWTWENGEDTTHPVATKKPNAFGLYDMWGNAREWCEGLDGEAVTVGGSYWDKEATITPGARWKYSIKWQERDPQKPKSKWWLSDGPFIGMRLVCER